MDSFLFRNIAICRLDDPVIFNSYRVLRFVLWQYSVFSCERLALKEIKSNFAMGVEKDIVIIMTFEVR